MASLGFRRPQFSEDSAWLPPWLQNHQVEASGNSIKELQSDFSHAETFSKEEGRYNSCHLFLSGEYTSQNTLSPTPENVLHLRLHLSSDWELQYSQSQDFHVCNSLHGSSKVLSVQQDETLDDLQEKTSQGKAYHNHDLVKVSPSSNPISVENVLPQSRINDDKIERQCGDQNGAVLLNSALPALENANLSSPANCEDNRHDEEKFNARHMKDADVSDAVELSIAASEALVIHELMTIESGSEIVPTGTILEAALQVKKARLEVFEGGISCSSPEKNETDYLSDLDDQTMENAFLDVGLFFNDLDDKSACDLDVSQVEETPLSENQFADNNESQHVNLRDQQDKTFDGSVLGLDNCDVAILVDPFSEKVLLVPEQPQVDVSSSPCMSKNAEVGVGSLVNDRFRSRWLGGWQVQGEDVSENVKQNSTKGIPKFFHCETSFLSESDVVAADENSVVQRLETEYKIPSQSSIHFEGVLDKSDEVNCISQEVRSSNQSLVDPLCSVVPCSISTGTLDIPLVKNLDDGEAVVRNSSSTKSEVGLENIQKVSDPNTDSGLVDREALPTVTGESFKATVKRRLASLKTYSTLLPKPDVVLSGQIIFQNQHLSSEYVAEPLSPKHYGNCNISSNKKNSELHFNLRSEFEYSAGRDHGQNGEVTIFRSPVVNHDDPAKDEAAELQLPSSMKRKSPHVLNRRERCGLQPSELPIEHLACERIPVQVVAQGTISSALHNKNLQKKKSKLKNPLSARNPVRKQVHFTEVEMDFQQNRNIEKPQTLQRNCSVTRANKRSKYSNLQSDLRIRETFSCSVNHINDEKILIFQGLEFLLTGFSSRKEGEIIRLINEYGGMVLSDVPSPSSNRRARRSARSNFQQLPIIICSKKLQTTKFLYGCAVNAIILKVKWLADSIAAGSLIPPQRYMILSNRAGPWHTRFGKSDHDDCSSPIFARVGIMLHGKPNFCTKLATIIKVKIPDCPTQAHAQTPKTLISMGLSSIVDVAPPTF